MKSFDEVIQYAIRHEEEEAAFYRGLAARAESKDLANVLLKRAEEEDDHKRHLEKIMAQHHLPDGKKRYPDPDLKLSDYLVEASPSTDGAIDYQDALIAAVKRENQAQALYQKMADVAEDASLREAFQFLAEQEGKHKNQLQQEYDENILEEN